MVSSLPSPSLIEILRTTVQQLEDSGDARREHPEMLKLKRQIVTALAELEMAKDSAADPETPPSELLRT